MTSFTQKLKAITAFNFIIFTIGSALPLRAQDIKPSEELKRENKSNSTVSLQAKDVLPLKTAQAKDDTSDGSKQKSDRINYIGIGGTIGLSDEGETALGDGGFSILGRVSLTENFSIHTSSVINDDNLITVAATGGIPIKNASGRTIVFPFLGGGISADTEDFNVDPTVTSGVDIPINSLITGTVRVNANFADDTDVGLILGVGIDLLDLL